MESFLSNAALVAAAVVLLIEQVMKLKIVPVNIANAHPVLTNVLLSIVCAFALTPIDFVGLVTSFTWSELGTALVQIGTVVVVAAIAYNQVVEKSSLKSAEGYNEKALF